MSVALTIKVNDTGAKELLAELRGLMGDLTPVNKHIAAAEEAFFRDYLTAVARGRHATADRLGARYTNYFENAAESPEGSGDATGATVRLGPRAAFARAFGPVTITPKAGKKWLTIPATAAAYGRRAGEFSDLKFIPFKKDLAALVQRGTSDGKFVVFYWLKKEIKQSQQRELLPSDKAIEEVAVDGIESYLTIKLRKGGAA